MKKIIFIALVLCFQSFASKAQFLMDMVDTTTEMGKGMLSMYKKLDGIKIGGYIQPQFQVTDEKGTKTFEGGNFSAGTNDRFMLRRSRVRFDYVHFESGYKPSVQIVFQFDANERGFTVRDVWGRISDNRAKLFSFTMGMFARPFSYEVNLSSSDRETPERGRMSQLLMKSERDLGTMVSLDSRRKDNKLKYLQAHLGVFNGQGINAGNEFDTYKDVIARVGLKPYPVSKNILVSAAASFLSGGLVNNTKYVFSTVNKTVSVDSTASNLNSKSPRKYFGGDAQIKMYHGKGMMSELRGEFVAGRQTGTATTSETPAALITGKDGFYVRNFNGAYFYFLQNIISDKHQLVLKYDWYDPNSTVKGNEITPAGKFTEADIRYNTFTIGYNYYMSSHIKLMLHYAMPKNEVTKLPGYTTDVKDNVATLRLQFRF